MITTTCLSNDVYVNQKDGLKMQSLCSLQAIPIYPWQELGFYFKLRDTLSNAQKCYLLALGFIRTVQFVLSNSCKPLFIPKNLLCIVTASVVSHVKLKNGFRVFYYLLITQNDTGTWRYILFYNKNIYLNMRKIYKVRCMCV